MQQEEFEEIDHLQIWAMQKTEKKCHKLEMGEV